MTDPLNGLRFDIYERVHLPDDVAAIEELEEIELVPHMQAVPQDDQVMLKGHLLLSGVYRPQNSPGGTSQLEHWIPVEITLPFNRVERVEDLAVEIDNFDVDLLSTRSLNVTGVLALRGLQATAPQIPVWRDDSFTVVHQAPAASEVPETLETPDSPRAGGGQEERLAQMPEPEAIAAPAVAMENERQLESSSELSTSEYSPPYYPSSLGREAGVWPNAYPEPEPSVESAPQPEFDLEQWIRSQEAESASLYEPDEESQYDSYAVNRVPESSGWGDLSSSRPESEISVPEVYTPVPEEKPEMKVALGGKPLETPVFPFSGVGLLSQLGDKGAAREAELQALRSAQAEAEEAEAAENKQARSSTGDELEWTRLFLTKGTEIQAFRKVKLCIVQREDTLDVIAARYHVQTRELQLYNRLSDPYLSAGQVLYIP
ncbi:MAG: LysM peptidoglycan-binding protein [Cohnella sp.]|nr:LysM peptidoglycan-binding protein [Cohnella sp.]